MSLATQTYGLPLGRQIAHGGSYASIGARIWLRLLASIQARLQAAAALRAERELLALAQQYESSMPSFAAELRAAHSRKS